MELKYTIQRVGDYTTNVQFDNLPLDSHFYVVHLYRGKHKSMFKAKYVASIKNEPLIETSYETFEMHGPACSTMDEAICKFIENWKISARRQLDMLHKITG